MKLSNNLSLAEVIKSGTAKRLGINNEPTIEHMENLKALALNIFQPLRDNFKIPIAVTSGYRSEDLNKAIGGSLKSQHCKGEAADIESYELSNADLFSHIVEGDYTYDQIILEFYTPGDPWSGWVHISSKRNPSQNRMQKLIAIKEKGKTVYKVINNIEDLEPYI